MVPNGSSGKTVSELNLLSTTPWRLSSEKKAPAENERQFFDPQYLLYGATPAHVERMAVNDGEGEI